MKTSIKRIVVLLLVFACRHGRRCLSGLDGVFAKKKLLCLIPAGMLLLSACSNPFGNESRGTATFTINLSGSGRMAYRPSAPGGPYPTISDLKYVVDFAPTGGGATIPITKDGPTTDVIKDTVALGEYTVTVKIYLRADGSLYASGSAVAPTPNPVTIVSGPNSINVEVFMNMSPDVRGDGLTPATAFKVYDPDSLRAVGSGTPPPGGAGSWGLGDHYILIQDINMSGQSFTPIGALGGTEFTGTFDGNSKTISGLTINSSITTGQGLFGAISGATAKLSNLTLTGVNIGAVLTGDCVGGVVGNNDSGTVENCNVSGSIKGDNDVGGVVGYNKGAVKYCYSTGTVTGDSNTGGVVGESDGGMVEKCYATGNITCLNSTVGGVVGSNLGSATVQNSYSTCTVSVTFLEAGGVVGYNDGTVSNCYSTGGVSGPEDIGGVVGYNYSGIVEFCYSTSKVIGTQTTSTDIGGIVGLNDDELKYCVALNTFITTGSSGSSMFRVVGLNTWTIDGLYGRDDIEMRIGANPDGTLGSGSLKYPVVGSTITDEDGADVNANFYNGTYSGTWWTGVAGFPAAGPTSPWIYESGSLPILDDIPGRTQDPTVTP